MRRYAAATGNPAVLIETGEAFDALARVGQGTIVLNRPAGVGATTWNGSWPWSGKLTDLLTMLADCPKARWGSIQDRCKPRRLPDGSNRRASARDWPRASASARTERGKAGFAVRVPYSATDSDRTSGIVLTLGMESAVSLHNAASPARYIANGDRDGLLLTDENQEPLATGDAGVEQISLQHCEVLGEDRDPRRDIRSPGSCGW